MLKVHKLCFNFCALFTIKKNTKANYGLILENFHFIKNYENYFVVTQIGPCNETFLTQRADFKTVKLKNKGGKM